MSTVLAALRAHASSWLTRVPPATTPPPALAIVLVPGPLEDTIVLVSGPAVSSVRKALAELGHPLFGSAVRFLALTAPASVTLTLPPGTPIVSRFHAPSEPKS